MHACYSASRFHQAVHSVGQRFGLVDYLIVVHLEPYLTSVRPDRLHSYVLREGSELGVGRWGEVLEDAELVADPVGGEVGGGRQGSFLEFEDQGPDGFGVELHYDGGLGCILFGRDSERVGDEKV